MLKHISISKKFIMAMCAVGAVSVCAAISSGRLIDSVNDQYGHMLRVEAAAYSNLTRASRNLQSARASIGDLLISQDPSQDASARAELKKSRDRFEELMKSIVAVLPSDKEVPTLLAQGLALIDATCSPVVQAASLANDVDSGALQAAFLRDCQPGFAPLATTITKKVESMQNSVDQSAMALEKYAEASALATYAGIGGGLTIFAALGFLLFRNTVIRPLRALEKQMRSLAAGDLSVMIVGTDRRDEVGSMAKAVQVFKDAANENKRLEAEAVSAREAQAASRDRQSAIDNAKAEDLRVFVHAVEAGFDKLSSGDLTVRMTQAVAPEFEPIRAKFNGSVETLEDTIGSVVGAVGTMRVGLNQITVAAGDLSQRTEQQAASLEETVAALAEVVRGVNQTAQGAEDARAAAAVAQKEAEKGGGVVSQAVTAMAEIEQSSAKIDNIIGVIDEIAFQTNLLALNAGVEAARAGEAGRGFAVVAQEVRGLAQRSAEAAKEIKELISTSSAQVAQGVEFVSASGRSLEQIVSQVGGVTTMISQMAHGAREQSVALKEVSVAADQMDKVTQQNAAMVEETTAAAQSLSTETEQLASLVDGFRTTSAQSAPGSRSSTRPTLRSVSFSSARPIPQMRATGPGGAASRPIPATDEWAEF